MGILNEINSHKTKTLKTKIIIGIIVSFIGVYIGYSYFLGGNTKNKEIKEIKSFIVKKGDLKTSISGDGKVLYKEDFNLNFPISGIVKEILKKEGDEVKAGEIIAKLDTTYLEIALDKAKANLQKVIADLNLKKEQYSKTDIELAKKQFESSKLNLDNTKINLENELNSAQNQYENAKIAYEALLEEKNNFESFNNTDLESLKLSIDSTKNDLEIAKKNLDLIKTQETEKYNNLLKDGTLGIDSINTYIDKYLYSIDKLLGVTQGNKDLNDSFEDYLGTKDTVLKSKTISDFRLVNNEFSDFKNEWDIIKTKEFSQEEIVNYINKTEKNINNVISLLENTLEVLKNSIVNISFTQNTIDSYIGEYENYILNLKKELEGFENLKQNISEQKVNLDTKVKMQENLISSLESKLKVSESSLDKFGNSTTTNKNNLEEKIATSKSNLEKAKTNLEKVKEKIQKSISLAEKQVNISEIGLNEKISGPTKTELAPYFANVASARVAVKEAEEKLQDGILKSPIDGKIVEINGNIGAFVGGDKDTYFATVINNDNFYLESYVEELDISRIKPGSKVYLTFDALDGVKLEGKVDFIGEKSSIDSNGIVTYKVDISFEKKNSDVKEGMTTYVEYITNEVKNAKLVPVESVKPVNGEPSIQLEDGTWKSVVTGFTDGKMVEIISGLELGDKILY